MGDLAIGAILAIIGAVVLGGIALIALGAIGAFA
jgi:hypothetical protein